MDYNKLGTSWYINYSFNDNSIQTSSDGNTCEEKYLFATEYVEDGSDMYDILKSHIIKSDFDDEAFNSGEEVVIFVDKNPDGEYDDTIVEGIDIKLNNYKCRLTAYNNSKESSNCSVGLRIYCADRTKTWTSRQKSHCRRQFLMDFCA